MIIIVKVYKVTINKLYDLIITKLSNFLNNIIKSKICLSIEI